MEIYARIDAASHVLAIDSPAYNYIIDVKSEDWVLIGVGEYDSYNALTDALTPDGIMDGEGLYNYVLQDGTIIPNPNKEDERPAPQPPQPTIEDRVADVEEALAAMMYGGEAI